MTPFVCEPHGNPVRPADPFTPDQCRACRVRLGIDTPGTSAPLVVSSPPVRSLPCVYEGAISSYCTSCTNDPNGLRHVRQCCHPTADRDACTRTSLGGAVQGCDVCPDYLADGPPAFEIATSGQGIGDAVSQLYACVGLAEAGARVVMRSNHDPGWFAGVSHPGLTLTGPGPGVDCNPDYAGQERAATAGTVAGRGQWYCDRLADKLGVNRFTPARPLVASRPAPVRAPGYAVLSPFSLHSAREWPAERWREVAAGLTGRGIQPVAVDRPGSDARLREVFGSTSATWHWGNPPSWTAALIANARLFVGNDSGMAHVAGLYGVPGVVVMTLFPFGFVFGEAPSLVGVGRHGGSLADVTAAEVLASIPTREPEQVAKVSHGANAGEREGVRATVFVPEFDPSAVVTDDHIRVGGMVKGAGARQFETEGGQGVVRERFGVGHGGLLVDGGILPDVFAVIRTHLHKRAATTEWLFREIITRWPSPRIVETGCVRSEWDWGAGYMTWLLGALLHDHGGHLVSVDITPAHCATARRLCRRWGRVTVAQSDSLVYLIDRDETVDVAYLDSLDVGEPGCADHGLREAKLVEPLMSERGLIVFDDTPPTGGSWSGKGELAVPFLISRGWKLRPESGYQTVLERA